MIQNFLIGDAGQIEVTVIGQIHDRVLIRGCEIVDANFVALVEKSESYFYFERARESFFAILARVGHFKDLGIGSRGIHAVPYAFVEATRAPVETVGAVILWQMADCSIERELPGGDAITVAPDRGAKKTICRFHSPQACRNPGRCQRACPCDPGF